MTPYAGVSTVIIAKSSITMQILKLQFVNIPSSSIFASIHFMLVAAVKFHTMDFTEIPHQWTD